MASAYTSEWIPWLILCSLGVGLLLGIGVVAWILLGLRWRGRIALIGLGAVFLGWLAFWPPMPVVSGVLRLTLALKVNHHGTRLSESLFAWCGEKQATSLLVGMLADPDPKIAKWAAVAMSHHPNTNPKEWYVSWVAESDQNSWRILERCLDGTDPEVVGAAFGQFVNTKDPAWVIARWRRFAQPVQERCLWELGVVVSRKKAIRDFLLELAENENDQKLKHTALRCIAFLSCWDYGDPSRVVHPLGFTQHADDHAGWGRCGGSGIARAHGLLACLDPGCGRSVVDSATSSRRTQRTRKL